MHDDLRIIRSLGGFEYADRAALIATLTRLGCTPDRATDHEQLEANKFLREITERTLDEILEGSDPSTAADSKMSGEPVGATALRKLLFEAGTSAEEVRIQVASDTVHNPDYVRRYEDRVLTRIAKRAFEASQQHLPLDVPTAPVGDRALETLRFWWFHADAATLEVHGALREVEVMLRVQGREAPQVATDADDWEDWVSAFSAVTLQGRLILEEARADTEHWECCLFCLAAPRDLGCDLRELRPRHLALRGIPAGGALVDRSSALSEGAREPDQSRLLRRPLAVDPAHSCSSNAFR